jgi:MYXO-CTERM domain-containing protein
VATFAALSRYESRVAGLALGIGFILIGTSLIVRGERANVGPYRGRTIRCIGALEIVGGVILAAGLLSDFGTCNRCGTDDSALDAWLVMLALILAIALTRIWGRRRS